MRSQQWESHQILHWCSTLPKKPWDINASAQSIDVISFVRLVHSSLSSTGQPVLSPREVGWDQKTDVEFTCLRVSSTKCAWFKSKTGGQSSTLLHFGCWVRCLNSGHKSENLRVQWGGMWLIFCSVVGKGDQKNPKTKWVLVFRIISTRFFSVERYSVDFRFSCLTGHGSVDGVIV